MRDKRSTGRAVAIGDAIEVFLRRNGIKKRDPRVEVFRAWTDAAGNALAKHTRPVRFAKGELTIEVSSAPHMNELQGFLQAELLERTNQILGSAQVDCLRFRLQRGR